MWQVSNSVLHMFCCLFHQFFPLPTVLILLQINDIDFYFCMLGSRFPLLPFSTRFMILSASVISLSLSCPSPKRTSPKVFRSFVMMDSFLTASLIPCIHLVSTFYISQAEFLMMMLLASNVFQGEEPLGAIHLRGCVVTAVEDSAEGEHETTISTFTPLEVSGTHSGCGQ